MSLEVPCFARLLSEGFLPGAIANPLYLTCHIASASINSVDDVGGDLLWPLRKLLHPLPGSSTPFGLVLVTCGICRVLGHP